MSADPNWRPDPAEVAKQVAAREAAITAQEVVVEKLHDLWDTEDRELHRMRQLLAAFQEAVANYVPVADR